MYRFKTKDGEMTRITPTDVRHIIPVGKRTGYVKLVLGGGHAVTVEGETEPLYALLLPHRLQHPAPSEASTPLEQTDVHEAVEGLREARKEARRSALLEQMPPETGHTEA